MVESLKNVKLHYFPLNWLGCVARMLLYHGKVKFEDDKITFEKWGELHKNFEFHQLPELEVDGQSFSQSQAIYIYLARKIGNLMGKSDEDEYQIISLLNCGPDIIPVLLKLIIPNEEEKKPDIIKKNLEIAIETIRLYASVWEKRYEKHGAGKYFLGNSLSLADFWLATFVGNVLTKVLVNFDPEIRKVAPKLSQMIDNLLKEEPFKGFFESDLFFKQCP